MNCLPLQLRPGTLAAEAQAWFIPGNSASRWLDELARSGLATMDSRLFVVPQSRSDRTSAGLLVIPRSLGEKPHAPAGFACKIIAGRLLVPVDAILYPPIAEEEVRALCLLPVTFFHPTLGLSSFEDEACLRVSDLLSLPVENPTHWNRARMGPPTLPELQAVVLSQPPSLDDLFGDAAENVGSEPPVDLPPAPNEPGNSALAKSNRKLREWFAKGVAKTLRQLPHGGPQRNWINSAEGWASRQLDRISQQLQNIRHQELNRLLHLFDTNPEDALRHAIPLSALAHRGKAPPSARLGSRPLNFDLARLGGGAADFWDVPGDLQQQLRLRYREMADREMQLGRHRRAAFIYAELLGDLISAANALKQGRHFREAATLYDVHLKNPREAIRCLVEGGFLAEASERYEQMGHWLEVADLQERLGNLAAAQAALRRVVAERLAQQDILGAAKLLDERLHAPDEALKLLLDAWPASRQAAACIDKAFQMFARLGRHDDALELIARLKQRPPGPLLQPLLATLVGSARDYPHELVRHQAADFTRVLIAQQLSRADLPPADAGRLMESLTRLAPQDRVLARDANRHLALRREAELRARRVTPPPLPGNPPIVVRRFELPRQMEWLQLRSEWHFFFAVGVTPKRLTLVRGVWEGEFQSLSWDSLDYTPKATLIFDPTRQQGRNVVLKGLGLTVPLKTFPAADGFFGIQTVAGTPDWLQSQSFCPLAVGEESCWTLHVSTALRGIVSCHDKAGKLLRTLDVTDDLVSGEERIDLARLGFAAVGNHFAITHHNHLVVAHSGGKLVRIELPGPAVGLFATPPHTRIGLAIMLEHGAVLHWFGTPGVIELDRDLPSPQGVFVPGGPLVLISESRMLLLDVDTRGVQKVTRFPVPHPGHRPIGICATSSPGQFALLGAKGEMTVYRAPQ